MSPFYRASDIDLMLAEFGVDVTVGATTVKGLLDIADESLLQGQAADFLGKTHSITVKTGALPGLEEGVAITADGIALQVMRTQQIDDGALTVILAARTA